VNGPGVENEAEVGGSCEDELRMDVLFLLCIGALRVYATRQGCSTSRWLITVFFRHHCSVSVRRLKHLNGVTGLFYACLHQHQHSNFAEPRGTDWLYYTSASCIECNSLLNTMKDTVSSLSDSNDSDEHRLKELTP
jgi:hypothetical protein